MVLLAFVEYLKKGNNRFGISSFANLLFRKLRELQVKKQGWELYLQPCFVLLIYCFFGATAAHHFIAKIRVPDFFVSAQPVAADVVVGHRAVLVIHGFVG